MCDMALSQACARSWVPGVCLLVFMAHTINPTLEVRQTGGRKKVPKVLNKFLARWFSLWASTLSAYPQIWESIWAWPCWVCHLCPHSAREVALKTKLQSCIKAACHFVLEEWPVALCLMVLFWLSYAKILNSIYNLCIFLSAVQRQVRSV